MSTKLQFIATEVKKFQSDASTHDQKLEVLLTLEEKFQFGENC
jgi:hypothetical protein